MYLQSSRSDAGLGLLRLLNETAGKPQEIIKEVVGIRVLLTRSLSPVEPDSFLAAIEHAFGF